MRFTFTYAAVAAVLTCGSGCSIQRTLLDGQIDATRRASSVFQTIGDYELARSASASGIVQFEGFHKLAPDNRNALFLLTKSWAGYAYAFPQDDWEAAVDADNEYLAQHHLERTIAAYERAIGYGRDLMSRYKRGGTFEASLRNDDTVSEWLTANFTDGKNIAELFWAGYAQLAQIDLQKDDPAMVADLFIPVAMIQRVYDIDPSFDHYTPTVALASYHARMPSAVEEMAESQRMFEMALNKTGGEALLVQLQYAVKYACKKGDRALYENLLTQVMNGTSKDPELRLPNAVAKRRAHRYLSKARIAACSFD